MAAFTPTRGIEPRLSRYNPRRRKTLSSVLWTCVHNASVGGQSPYSTCDPVNAWTRVVRVTVQ